MNTDIQPKSPFFFKTSKDKNILNENFTTYDGLGIKLKYSFPWVTLTKLDKSTCHNIDLCLIHLGINKNNTATNMDNTR